MSITVTNPEGRNVEFKDQRGPTCGLYALSFVREYLYDIKIPATEDGDKTSESLRNKFKKDGKTVIGELYDATSSMATYIEKLAPSKIKCQSVACDVTSIIETLNGGGLCMVPFCVDASGKPDHSGIHAHWCVLLNVWEVDGTAVACHWGKDHVFNLSQLEESNKAIKDVEEQYWGKIPAASYSFSIPIEGLNYVQCKTNTDTSCKCEYPLPFPIKSGSIKSIPAKPLSQTLAGKMLVFRNNGSCDENAVSQ